MSLSSGVSAYDTVTRFTFESGFWPPFCGIGGSGACVAVAYVPVYATASTWCASAVKTAPS